MDMKKTNAGVWIDHRDAVVVALTETGEEITRIQSSVEKQLRRAGERPDGAFEARQVPADDSRQREYTGDLSRYYDGIISHLSEAGSILLFGPGEAKGELKKRLEKHPAECRKVELETAERMSEPQLVALVRRHFHHDPARRL